MGSLSKRITIPNSPKLPSFDSTKPSSELLYLDFAQLYPYALTFPVPIGDYTSLSPSQLENFNLSNYGETKGCFLSVNLRCPEDLAWQAYYHQLPFCPSKETVEFEELTAYQKECLRSISGRKYLEHYVSTPKLVQSFRAKNDYVLHHEELKFYLSKGMILESINEVVEFTQAPIFKELILNLTGLRSQSTKETERNFLKLMTNSMFGRMILNVRDYLNIEICTNRQRAVKLLRKHTYIRHHHIPGNSEISIFAMKRPKIFIKEFIYIGATVLSLSKLHYYNSYYNTILGVIPRSRMNLIYLDTDSMILEVFFKEGAQNLLEEMEALDSIIDRSSFGEGHTYYHPGNKGRLGFLKDECKGYTIAKFVAESPKKYIVSMYDSEKNMYFKKFASRGFPKSLMKTLDLETFEDNIQSSNTMFKKVTRIQSSKHELNTIVQNRMILNNFYVHRSLCNDMINTVCWGCNFDASQILGFKFSV